MYCCKNLPDKIKRKFTRIFVCRTQIYYLKLLGRIIFVAGISTNNVFKFVFRFNMDDYKKTLQP